MAAARNLRNELNVENIDDDDASTEVTDETGPDDEETIEEDPIQQLLELIGFSEDETERIIQSGLQKYSDFKYFSEKDIRDVAEEFAKRTVNDGRIIFGIGRTKRMIGMMHWIQDNFRCSIFNPDPNEFNLESVEISFERALTRKRVEETFEATSKTATPGKFKDERKWTEWEPAFENYLATIPGVNGIPLKYIIRKDVEPALDETFDDFTVRSIYCAPLTGAIFESDARRVHQLILGFVQGEPAEQYLKSLAKKENGRLDMIALRSHYGGEGNISHRIGEAERLMQSLHYKGERSMPFSRFLEHLQKMFNIYEREGEPLEESAKIRTLFSKIQSSTLAGAVASLKVKYNTDGCTFSQAANHLSSELCESNEYITGRRNISSAGTTRAPNNSTSGRGRSGMYNRDRTGRGGRHGRGGRGRHHGGRGGHGGNGYIPREQWNKLTQEQQAKMREQRAAAYNPGAQNNKIATLSVTELDNIRSIISAVQSSNSPANVTSNADDDTKPAGNSFGGRSAAAHNKRQKHNNVE